MLGLKLIHVSKRGHYTLLSLCAFLIIDKNIMFNMGTLLSKHTISFEILINISRIDSYFAP